VSLADQIIEHGPFVAGEVQPGWMRLPKAVDYNALRDELIEGRRLRAAAEARSRFQISVNAFRDGEGAYVALRHGICDIAEYEDEGGGPTIDLAELDRRADEHTEGCA